MAAGWIEGLKRDLKDSEFTKLYGAAQAKDTFAITIAKARLGQGLTQKELASKLGATQPYIAKLERGDANPTIGTIGSMLAILGFGMVIDLEPLIPPEPTTGPSTIVDQANDIAQAFLNTTADAEVPCTLTGTSLNTAG